jgi:hypothetical protein
MCILGCKEVNGPQFYVKYIHVLSISIIIIIIIIIIVVVLMLKILID